MVFSLAQACLAMYGLHRIFLLVLYARARRAARRPPAPGAVPEVSRPWPRVTVQLPVHDERYVVERLIDAACALDYPCDRLDIQVLDDSTDDTTARARARAAFHRAHGVRIDVFHRRHRRGFKAGALRHGLAYARGELVCIFDADFVPAPDFLRRMVGAFDDPQVGMVQARWGHLNRESSALTQAQALFLDGHFRIEHVARAGSGRWFNFNGTAGVWRRSCIEQAGGWTHDTLTEDLDLSYRAQMAGWRFVYRPDVVADAELPVRVADFKSQQRRWTKGSFQTARKILPALWRSRAPWRVKLEAFCHLTNNAAYLLLLGSVILLGPVLALPALSPRWLSLGALGFLFVTGMGAVTAFFLVARRAMGEPVSATLALLPGALLLGVGMSLNNGRAAIEAFLPRIGAWERTPKYGIRDGASGTEPAAATVGGFRGRPALEWAGWGEGLLALYLVSLLPWAVALGRWTALPFIAFLAAGFGWVAWLSYRGAHPAPVPATVGLPVRRVLVGSSFNAV